MTTYKKPRVTIALVLVLVLMMSLIPVAYAAVDVTPNMKLTTNKGSYISQGDTVSFTLDINNSGDDNWNTIKLTSTLKFVEVDAGTVRIDGVTSNYTFTSAGKLTVDVGTVAPGATKRVTFDATVLELTSSTKISYSFTASGYNTIKEQRFIVVATTFTPILHQSAAPVIRTVYEGDSTVTGTGVAGAVVTVTLPDNTTHNVTVAPDGTWTLNVPTGTTLYEGQIVKAYQTETGKLASDTTQTTVLANQSYDPSLTKTSRNLTTVGNVAKTGDVIEYTITATNNSTPSSQWHCIVTDTISEYVTLDTNSIKVNGQTAAYTYNTVTRLLTVDLGNISGNGSYKTLTFEVKINDNASGTINNTAYADGGDIDAPDPNPPEIEKSAAPTINAVIEGADTVTGEGVPGANIIVTFPDGMTTGSATVDQNGEWTVDVPNNVTLEPDDVIYAVQQEPGKSVSDQVSTIVQPNPDPVPFAEKTSRNLSRQSGLARPGDVIEYTITARNDGASSSVWQLEVTDPLHEGLTFVAGSVTINNTPATSAQYSYDSSSHVLKVDLGNIYGGETWVIKFQCTINEKAYNQTIYNDIGIAYDQEPIVVIDKSPTPTIDEVKETDEIVTGTGEPDAKIVVTFPDGNTEETTVKPDGTWEVEVPPGTELHPGNEITAVQEVDGMDPSDEATAVVVADRSVLPYSEIFWTNVITNGQSAKGGDTIEYEAIVYNEGTTSSVWPAPVAIVQLHDDTTFAGGVKINGTSAAAVGRYSYDSGTHTLTVYLYSIVGGGNNNFSFRATVNANVPDTTTELDAILEAR